MIRNPRTLTREEMIEVISEIQALLFLESTPEGESWNLNKVWDEWTLPEIAEVLMGYGLMPGQPLHFKGEIKL